MITDRPWKQFKFTKLFDIRKGFYNKKPEHTKEGNIPFMGATDSNNGVTEYYSLEDIDAASKTGDSNNSPLSEKIFPPNALCVTNNGSVGFAYYMDREFTCSHDVNPLYLKNGSFNKYTALFVATVIQHDRYRWAYGRKWRPIRMQHSTLELPAINDEEPDWKFMEEFIKKMEKEYKTNNVSAPSITPVAWKKFKLGNLFDSIKKSKANIKSEIVVYDHYSPGLIPFISRTENNNGCDCYVERDESLSIQPGNAITIGDTTSTMSYHEGEFVTGDHIIVCRASWMNVHRCTFLLAVLEKERYRYTYGRSFNKDLVKETEIPLPAKDNLPDWEWIDNYIRSCPYGDLI